MELVGFDYTQQFSWGRTPQERLEDWLRTATFDRWFGSLYLPPYSGTGELPVGENDLYFHFVFASASGFQDHRELVTFNIFQAYPNLGYNVQFSGPSKVQWDATL